MTSSMLIKTAVFSTILLSGAVAFAAVPAVNNTPATFNPAQQQAIEKIVHDYLISNPQVLVEVATSLQKQQQSQWQSTANKAVPQIAQALFANPISPVIGNPNGDVTLVEFFDYQCPHCKEMGPQIDDLIKNDKNLRIVLKALPIFGENSEFAARAGIAAEKQGKFLAFNDALLNIQVRLTSDVVLKVAQQAGLNIQKLQADMQSPQITQELKDNDILAKKLNLIGTPAFLIAKVSVDPKAAKVTALKNPILIPGAVDEQTLVDAINQARGTQA